jgi:hypothetical protein
MAIENRAGVPAEDLAAIERVVAGHRTLEDVVQWGLAHVPLVSHGGAAESPPSAPPRVVADVVVQDEYTHDVVVPYGDGRYLVYDTT